MEKFMKIFVKTFVQSGICALSIILLLSGQQAFSAPAALTSAGSFADFTGTSHWSTGGCISANYPTAINSGDTFTICGGHALTLGLATSNPNIAGITVNSGGTLTLGAASVPLTMSSSGILTNNGGTISTDIGAHVLSNIVHTAGSTTLSAANMTSISGNVTYTAGILALPTLLTTINGLFSALLAPATTYSMPATVTSLAGGVTASGGAGLTLGVANIVAGTVTMGVGGSILGVLKLKNEDHIINGATGSIAILNLSVITGTGKAITFTPSVGTITVNAFTMPAAPTANNAVTLTCIGTVGVEVGAISLTGGKVTNDTAPGTYTCTAPTVTTILGLFSSGASFTMPTAITSLAGGVTVTGGVLTLSAANIVTGAVTITMGGSIAGTLKLDNAAHAINGFGSIAELDLSAITGTTTAITFTPAPAGSTITIGAFTPPGVSSAVTLTCNGTIGGTLTLANPTGSYTCTASSVNPVSAPIFSLRGESRVFLEEVI